MDALDTLTQISTPSSTITETSSHTLDVTFTQTPSVTLNNNQNLEVLTLSNGGKLKFENSDSLVSSIFQADCSSYAVLSLPLGTSVRFNEVSVFDAGNLKANISIINCSIKTSSVTLTQSDTRTQISTPSSSITDTSSHTSDVTFTPTHTSTPVTSHQNLQVLTLSNGGKLKLENSDSLVSSIFQADCSSYAVLSLPLGTSVRFNEVSVFDAGNLKANISIINCSIKTSSVTLTQSDTRTKISTPSSSLTDTPSRTSDVTFTQTHTSTPVTSHQNLQEVLTLSNGGKLKFENSDSVASSIFPADCSSYAVLALPLGTNVRFNEISVFDSDNLKANISIVNCTVKTSSVTLTQSDTRTKISTSSSAVTDTSSRTLSLTPISLGFYNKTYRVIPNLTLTPIDGMCRLVNGQAVINAVNKGLSKSIIVTTAGNSINCVAHIHDFGSETATSAHTIVEILTPDNVTVILGKSKDVLKIHSFNSSSTNVEGFNASEDMIDLNDFTEIKKFEKLSITKGSAIVHLPKEQTVVLQNITPTDLSAKNFIFSTITPTYITENSHESDYILPLILGSVLAPLCCVGSILGTILAFKCHKPVTAPLERRVSLSLRKMSMKGQDEVEYFTKGYDNRAGQEFVEVFKPGIHDSGLGDNAKECLSGATYSVSSMNSILSLRLSQKKFITVPAIHLKQNGPFILANNRDALLPILHHTSFGNPHWVGAMIEGAKAVFIDPENNLIPQELFNLLPASLRIEQKIVQTQSYGNNCGPELIEHFAEAITGSRVSEEFAPEFHRKLGYKLTYSPSNKFNHLTTIIAKYNIKISIQEVLTSHGTKQLALHAHPDKGGSADDFTFVWSLNDPEVQYEIKHLAQMHSWFTKLHTANIGIKAADLIVDWTKAYLSPTWHNVEHAALSSIHFVALFSGVTKFSIATTAASIGYSFCVDDFSTALTNAAIASLSLVTFPILAVVAPKAAVACGVSLAAYSAYQVAESIYELWYKELAVAGEMKIESIEI